MSRLFTGLAVLACFPACARAADWPGWRGPHGDGTSDEKSFPLTWSATEHVRWKTPVPGKGHSSPVVSNGRVFVTTCLEDEQKRLVLCYDRKDGKELWRREVVQAKLEGKHKLNSYASSTPVADGRHVWVTFFDPPKVVVVCLDFDGNEVWRKSPGEFHSVHGFCSSPILDNDLLVVNCDQDALAFIVAFDKSTGKEVWRTDRPNRTRSYCVPIVIEAAGRRQLVLSGSKCVASYDPATGKQHWLIDGPTEQFVASLVYRNGMLFMTGGFPEYHLMGIRPDGTGNVTETHVAWHHTKSASYVPSPIAWGDYFYVVTDGGLATCLDVQTGERPWMSQRLGKHHSASPVAANGYLYFPDDDGVTHVLKAGPKFERIARNPLGEECYASPALSDGQIFFRTSNHLWCVE
jgi:outer membrane protein assembly factor BamB